MAYLDGVSGLAPWGGPKVQYVGFSAAAATAAITGTATDGVTESEIVTGGETIILTLTNDTWVASGATFDAQRQNIIDGLDSAQSELTGWNNEVRDKLAVTTVVRTSDTVVTITLSAQSAYDITADETITVTIPGSALVTSSGDVTATPTFSVTADAVVDESASGGWEFLNTYESELARRRDEERKRQRLEEESDRIEGPVDREIALLLRQQEALDARRADYERLAVLARQNADIEAAREYSERVAKAFERAVEQGNYSAIEAMDRELKRAREEEEFLFLSILMTLE